jgi:hypothetical protein
VKSYEKPQVTDLGTLVELTASGHQLHRDIPKGSPGSTPNSAFS